METGKRMAIIGTTGAMGNKEVNQDPGSNSHQRSGGGDAEAALNFTAKNEADRRLVKEAMLGSSDAIERVIELHYQDILYFTISQIGNTQDGEDVAQHAISRVIEGMGTLKDPSKFKSWMMSIVHNGCVDYLRKRNHMTKTLIYEKDSDEDPLLALEEEHREFLPESALIDEELRGEVLRIIQEMPENYAECLRLRYFSDLKNPEIAEVLDVSKKKVENDLLNAKKLFKKRFEESTGISYRYSAASAGAVPILTQIFNVNRSEVVTPELSARVLHAAREQIAAGSTVAAAGTTALQANSLGHALAIVGGGAVGVAAVGAALALALGQQPEVEPMPELAPVVEAAPQPEPDQAPEAVAEEEAPINTIADMIGVDEADLLAAFEQQGASESDWLAFIDRTGAHEERTAAEFDYTYRVYLLQKQDKQLMLAARTDVGGSVAVIAQFGFIEELPRMSRVILMFP